MPASHHRKKHKEHLRQFRHTSNVTSSSRKSNAKNATALFTFIGAAFGLAVGFFGGTSFSITIAAIFIGSIAGYFIGKKINSGK